jgi:L-lactate dehydrogenase complex protein LldF
VRIPIPRLLNRLRHEAVRAPDPGGEVRDGELWPIPGQGSRRTALEAGFWALWSWICARPRLYRALTRLAPLVKILGPAAFGPWTRTRSAPPIAPRSLHRLIRDRHSQ